MRHRKAGVKLGRTSSHRSAMFRNMVTSLLKHGKIKTTDTKAKELRRWADHIITLAKRGDLHARRQAMAIVREKQVVHKIFEVAAEQFGNREGGYTRLTKLGHRAGDAAPMTLVELVSPEDAGDQKKKAPKAKPQTTAAPAAKEVTPPADEAVKEEAAEAAPEEEAPATEATEAEEETAEEAAPEAAPEAADDAPAEEEADKAEDEEEKE